MLLFQLPVRCKKCSSRMYASLTYVKWLRKGQAEPADRHSR